MSNEAAPASSLTDKEREAIAQMPYEEARDKLIQAVQALEAGGLNLDQSMRQWEIGEALAKRAQSLLGEVSLLLPFSALCLPADLKNANDSFPHYGISPPTGSLYHSSNSNPIQNLHGL